ncbi:MAG TPA: PQQ-binding-like beta-propeller repeat protein [Rhodothermales bacterium]|nr:PQQ-binding-like beta-propeller repeat protein [Rhodothermales bacterium]
MNYLTRLVLFASLFALTRTAEAQNLSRIEAETPLADEQFGWATALSPDGTLLAVGAPSPGTDETGMGAVDLYTASDNEWVHTVRVTGSDVVTGDEFGSAVAFVQTASGLYLLVGARDHDAGGVDEGAVYVFARNGDNWNEIEKLLPPDSELGDAFGLAIDADQERVIIGAHFWNTDAGTDRGAAFVYEFDGDTFVHDGTLTGDVSNVAQFGSSVAIVGDWAFVGALADSPGGLEFAGSVFVYERAGASEWVFRQRITADDAQPSAEFGGSLDAAMLSVPTVVIGAARDDDNRGAVYVFEYRNNEWSESTKLLASGGVGGDRFGSSVALSASEQGLLSAGAPRRTVSDVSFAGAGYVFEGEGEDWTETLSVSSSTPQTAALFGFTTTAVSNWVVFGAIAEDGQREIRDAGAVYSLFIGETEKNQPVAQADWGFTVTGEPVVIDVLANDYDSDGDALTIAGVDAPEVGSASIDDGRIVYTPAAGYEGDDEFAYTISDNDGGFDAAEVRVRIADPETRLFESAGEETRRDEPEIVRSRRGNLNLDYLFSLPFDETAQLTLNLFDDAILVTDRELVEQWGEHAFTWYGVGPRPGDEVVLELDLESRTVFGTFWLNGTPYELQQVEGALYEIAQINTAAIVDELEFEDPEEGVGGGLPIGIVDGSVEEGGIAAPTDPGKRSTTSNIDLLILYTEQAQDSAGSRVQMLQTIRNAVNLTNLTYRRSRIDARVRIAGTAMVNYDETGKAGRDLDNLKDNGRDSGNDIYGLRHQVNADIVGLVVSDFEACGRAYIMNNVSTDHSKKAYFVIAEAGSCMGSNLSFAHEIGHIQGARHDRFKDFAVNKSFPYAHGHVNPSDNWSIAADQWRTVMAYNDLCDCDDEPGPFCRTTNPANRNTPRTPSCNRLIFWSDPDSTWNGFSRGSTGNKPSDNAQVLRNTVSTVAAFMSQTNHTISGTILDAETGEPFIEITVRGEDGSGIVMETVTDSTGYYVFFLEPGTSLTVTPELNDYTFEPESPTYTNINSDITRDFTGFELFEVSGQVTLDPSGVPLDGIELRGVTGLNVATDDTGGYYIDLPWGWSGRIAPTSGEYTFTPEAIELDSIDADTTQDFSALRNRYEISGFIKTLVGDPVNSVDLQGFPEPTQTNSGGFYSIEIEHGWSGTVTPVISGFDFEPFSRDYINLSGSRDHDYIAYPGPFARSVWPAFGADGANSGAVDAPTVRDELDWSFRLLGEIAAPVITADETILVASNNGLLRGYDVGGVMRWETQTDFISIEAAPVVATGGIVFIAEADISGRVTAFSYIDRSVRWRASTGGAVVAAPTLASDGSPLVGSISGDLVAFSPSGAERWRYSTGGAIHSAPAVSSDGAIYVGSDDDKLHAINEDGTQKWTFTTSGDVRSAPTIADDGAVYFGSNDDNVYAVNPGGSEKWRFATAGDVTASGALDSNGNLYIGSTDSTLYALSPSGQELWRYKASGPITSPPSISQQKIRRFTQQLDEEVLYVADDAGILHALNLIALSSSASRLKWTYPLELRSTSGPVLTGDGLIIGNDAGLVTKLAEQSTAWTQVVVLIQDGVLSEREVAIAIWMGEQGGPFGIIGGLPEEDPCGGGPLIIPDCGGEFTGRFGDTSPLVLVPAEVDLVVGLIDVKADVEEVISGATTEGLLGTFPVRFEAGELSPLVAAGLLNPQQFPENPDGRPVALNVYHESALAVQPSEQDENVTVVAGHFSTDAGELQIVLNGPVVASFDGLRYGDLATSSSIPPGVYEAEIVVQDGAGKGVTAATGRFDLTGRSGEVVSFFASGFMDAESAPGAPTLGLVAASADEVLEPVSVSDELPEALGTVPKILGAYPDPFRSQASIRYVLPESGVVRIDVFDVRGRRVAVPLDGVQQAGEHVVIFDGSGLSSGVYFYRIVTDSGVATGRMVAVR